MKLLVQPEDGAAPLVAAVKSAKKTIEIVVFRFDRREIETALEQAVERNVAVRALIAYTNRGGDKNLRKLEKRFLEAGIIVARTANDLSRYHGKMMIIDGRVLYLLSFNFIHQDIDESRGFGIVTRNAKFVREARRLFEADSARQPYTPGLNTFVVSPLNARKELSAFIKKARKQLLIYDPQLTDPEMIRLLQDRVKAGVDVRIIGKVAKLGADLKTALLATMRLHTRTMIRDHHQAFVGSQSLRNAELTARREIGLIVRDSKVVNKLLSVFEKDWASKDPAGAHVPDLAEEKAENVEALAKEMPPLTTAVREAVRKAVANTDGEVLGDDEVKATVKKAVKKAVKEAMKEAVQEREESN